MSLNGLEDAKVKEAHEAAVAEPGGWFLLKYVSRDEVELLGRGNGGIVEIRNAIAAHEEPTPLFGFLRYRRRNVVIKYVPEDCSRLVQARVAVHFNAVTDRLSPHDTTFPIVSPKELKDSTLSAACSLHTASESTSSSTSSLRRRRLMEIAEDEEEEHRAKRQSTVPEERPPTAKTFDIPDIASPETAPSVISVATVRQDESSSTPTNYRAIIADLETTPPPPREPLNLDITHPESPTKSIDDGRRKSSQSTRPDLFSYSSYSSNGKPKIKLGPRPSLDVAGRPHTSASASQFRPVSSLPAGLKLSKSPSMHRARPQMQHKQEAPSMTISPPTIPETHVFAPQLRPHTSGGRPTTSSGVSMRPPASPSSLAPSNKFPLMTPEKARLMKALELRKKKEQAAAAAMIDSPTPKPRDEDPHEVAPLPNLEERPVSAAPPKEVQDTLQMLNDMAEKAELGIAFDARSTLKTDESDATRSDSYPVSPVGPSEKADSTRASSISESTDETIQQEPKASEAKEDTLEPNEVEKTVEPEPEQAEKDIKGEGKPGETEDLPLLLPLVYTPPTRSPVPEWHESTISGNPSGDFTTIESELNQSPQSIEASARSEKDKQDVSESMESSDTIASANEQHLESDSQDPPVPQKEWKIPRSKFSSQNLRAETATPEMPNEPLPSAPADLTVEQAPKSPVGSTFSKDAKSSPEKTRRRGLIEPIRTDMDLNDRSPANSDAHLSSDDEFMDELQSAVVQEAMPISVAKSPISPVLPSPKKAKRFSRTFSNPLRRDKDETKLNIPQQAEKRTVSAGAAFLNKINQQQDRPVAKKVNLGSGISQRIKALEKLSSTGSPPTAGPVSTPGGTSTSFFSVRKASIRENSSSSLVSVADRANSLSRNTPSPSNSRDGSPDIPQIRDRSGSIKSRVDAFKSSPTPMSKAHKSRPESISVTARIVRDPAQPFPARPESGNDASDFKPLDLKKSPLVITHQKAVSEPQSSKETIQERRMSKESSRSSAKGASRERRSSITVIKDFISEGRTSFSERRRSMNIEIANPLSPKSPSRPPSTHQTRPVSISSRLSISSRDFSAPSPTQTIGSSSSNDEKPEKKASRTSRMISRMSSSLTSSRKNITHAMSPTVREESEPPFPNDSRSLASSRLSQNSATPLPTLISLGEVNVQFPDSLLWKRRSMALDSQGFLILTAIGTAKDKNAGSSRKFHFSDFRVPVIPDVEMQELPNSVVLDFVEGGGLQVACEDRAGQGRVLKVLQDAHKSWGAYGQ